MLTRREAIKGGVAGWLLAFLPIPAWAMPRRYSNEVLIYSFRVEWLNGASTGIAMMHTDYGRFEWDTLPVREDQSTEIGWSADGPTVNGAEPTRLVKTPKRPVMWHDSYPILYASGGGQRLDHEHALVM